MGNCCAGCFEKLDKRKYLRTRYNVESGFGIEFENLMDDEPTGAEAAPKSVTDRERTLLLAGRYDDLLYEQKRIDAEIDLQLTKHEDEIKAEEEAYYEAQREAARVAKQQQEREQASKTNLASNSIGAPNKSWLGDDEDWDIAGGEDDFELFLESVKARSLTVKPLQLFTQQVVIDNQSLCSSTMTRCDRSITEASSMDLEWEHEQGMVAPPKIRPEPEGMVNEEELSKNTEQKESQDLEWDTDDFVSADTAQLVDSEIKLDEER